MPLPTWPARLRRYFEIDAMIYLAGPIAEDLRRNRPLITGYLPDTQTMDERRAERELARLSSGEARMLARGDDEHLGEPKRDEQGTLEAATKLARDERAGLLLAFLRAETREFVHSALFQRRLQPLVAALLAETDLGARDVCRILKEAAPQPRRTPVTTPRRKPT
jgi:hypothetical protein